MGLLTRWWFAVLVVSGLFVAWSLTVAPWAPWHDRNVAEVELALHAPTDRPQNARSAPFSLSDGPAQVSVSAGPSGDRESLPGGFIGSADWLVRRAGRPGPAVDGWVGSSELSPEGSTTTETLDPVPSSPREGLFLSVTAVTSGKATVVVRLAQSRDRIAGLPILMLLGIVAVVLMGIPATATRSRRSKPVIFPPTHEHY